LRPEIFRKKNPRQKFWWDVFLKDEYGERFIRRTRAVSAQKAVNNVWFTDFKEPYFLEGRLEEAKELKYYMYARLVEPKPRHIHHRPAPKIPGQLSLFKFKKN